MIQKKPTTLAVPEADQSTLGARLRLARKRKGLTLADAADRFKVSVQAISQWENNIHRPDMNKLGAITNFYAVDSEWLLGPTDGDEETQPVIDLVSDRIVDVGGREFAALPLYNIEVAAGAGAENYDERPADVYLISLQALRAVCDAPLDQISIFQVTGDSMADTLHSGDLVFVDRRKSRLTREGIYTLNFQGDALVKRVSQHLETGAVTLISDNPKYPAQVISSPDLLSVIGRVFLSIRRH